MVRRSVITMILLLTLVGTVFGSPTLREYNWDCLLVHWPRPWLQVEKETEESLWQLRMLGGRDEVLARNEPLFRRRFQQLRAGSMSFGSASFVFSPSYSFVSHFQPLLGEAEVRPLDVAEFYDGQLTVEMPSGRMNYRVHAGDRRGMHSGPLEQVFLAGHLPDGFVRAETDNSETGFVAFEKDTVGGHERLEVWGFRGDRFLPDSGRWIILDSKKRRKTLAIAVARGPSLPLASSRNQLVYIRRYGKGSVPFVDEWYTLIGSSVVQPKAFGTVMQRDHWVSDFRFSEDKPVSYRWSGALISLAELQLKYAASDDTGNDGGPNHILIGAGIAILGLYFLLGRSRAPLTKGIHSTRTH